jgi:hypothetical protein
MSATRTRAETKRGSQYFVNILSVVNGTDTFDSTGTAMTATGIGDATQTFTIGTVLVRDMGTNITVPGDYSGTGTVRKTLRKVQFVQRSVASLNTTLANANDGTGGIASGTATTAQGNVTQPGFGCFYIELGGINVQGSKWVSLNLPN